MRRARYNFAFTLIELVVVLMIISITAALAAPSLRGWSDGAKLRNATDEFLAATRYARGESIIRASEYVLTIDRAANGYYLRDAAGNAPREFGQTIEMPTSFTIDLTAGGEGGSTIRFFPDSRATPAVVRITSAHGETVEIASNAPAEPFKIVGIEP